MFRWLTIFSIILLAFGCEKKSSVLSSGNGDDDLTGDSGVDGSGSGNGDSDTDTDGDGDTDINRDSETSTECDRQEFSIEPIPVRLMILQDISDSMKDLASEANQDKWTVAKFALTDMLNKMVGKGVEIGFNIFNDLDDPAPWCGVDRAVIMDCAIDNEQKIIDELPKFSPAGNTPLYCSMANFLNPTYAPKFVAGGANRYLLLISDGADNCTVTCDMFGADITPQDLTTRTTELLSAEIKTFVIGFSLPVSDRANPDWLNAIAAAGGTGRTTFFEAQSGNDLEQALTEVSKAIVNCVFEIDEPNAKADPDKVNFYFGDDVIKQDDKCAKKEGWTWVDDTHTKVEFCEKACDAFASDISKKISASFGCPTIVIPDIQ